MKIFWLFLLPAVATIIIADLGNQVSECRVESDKYEIRLAKIEREFFLFPKHP